MPLRVDKEFQLIHGRYFQEPHVKHFSRKTLGHLTSDAILGEQSKWNNGDDNIWQVYTMPQERTIHNFDHSMAHGPGPFRSILGFRVSRSSYHEARCRPSTLCGISASPTLFNRIQDSITSHSTSKRGLSKLYWTWLHGIVPQAAYRTVRAVSCSIHGQ